MKVRRHAAAALLVTAMFTAGGLPSPASASTAIVPAEADSYVLSTRPKANKGTEASLRIRNDTRITYIRFDVPDLPPGEEVSVATLRVFAVSVARCALGVEVFRAANDTWGEAAITWGNQPGPAGSILANTTWTSKGAYREFDVSTAVTGTGPVSFLLRHPTGCNATSDVSLNSRESASNPPQLVVETLPAPPPAPVCSDGLDNDSDGLSDFPADPGCASVSDTDEVDVLPPTPACSDNQDNDADGLIDFPADPGCDDAVDDDEAGAKPGWIVSCNYSHSSHDDPIVFPGQPGAAHEHDFVGSATTDAFSTPSSLLAGGKTCAMPEDTSAYWVPALWIHDGVDRVLPTAMAKNALFYYRRIAAPPGTSVHTIPDGLKMLMGNARAGSPDDNPGITSGNIVWKCGPGVDVNLAFPPSRCESGVMVVSLRFPNCWDGINLDSPDHLSQMSYPVSGRCPSSHPIVLPRLGSFYRYPVGTDPIGTVTLASGPWFTIHQDFLNAWDPVGLQAFVDQCINAFLDCGTNPVVTP